MPDPESRDVHARILAAEPPIGDVAPSHGGLGIANLPAGILATLGVSHGGMLPPADDALLPPQFVEDLERVVLVVVDGLGWHQLDAHLQDGPAGFLARAAEAGNLAPATSVLPSTTATALTTLHTGLAPAQHGITGGWAHLPDHDLVANLLQGRAADGRPLPEVADDLAPRALVPARNLPERVRDAGLPAHVVTAAEFRESFLTRVLYGSVEGPGYEDLGGLAREIRNARSALGDSPGIVLGYWAGVDLAGHLHRPDGAPYRQAVAEVEAALDAGLGQPEPHGATLVVVTADHGFVPTPGALATRLHRDPDLPSLLAAPPTGEVRCRFLHAREGRSAEIREILEARYDHALQVATTDEVLAAGMLGPHPPEPTVRARYGDLVVLPRRERCIPARYGPDAGSPQLPGHHGGTTEAEMLVPVLAARFP